MKLEAPTSYHILLTLYHHIPAYVYTPLFDDDDDDGDGDGDGEEAERHRCRSASIRHPE